MIYLRCKRPESRSHVVRLTGVRVRSTTPTTVVGPQDLERMVRHDFFLINFFAFQNPARGSVRACHGDDFPRIIPGGVQHFKFSKSLG